MKPKVDVRRMTVADAGEIVPIHLEAFRGYMNAQLGRAYVRAFLCWFAADPHRIALAAFIDDRPVGYVVGARVGYGSQMSRALFRTVAAAFLLRPHLLLQRRFRNVIVARLKNTFGRSRAGSPDPHLLPEPSMSLVGIGVAANARGAGVGDALMREFEACARQLQMRSMVLSVYTTNDAARLLYEKSGWRLLPPAGNSATVSYGRVLSEAKDGI